MVNWDHGLLKEVLKQVLFEVKETGLEPAGRCRQSSQEGGASLCVQCGRGWRKLGRDLNR